MCKGCSQEGAAHRGNCRWVNMNTLRVRRSLKMQWGGGAGTCVLPLRGQCASTSSVMNDSHRIFVKVEVDGIFLVLSQ